MVFYQIVGMQASKEDADEVGVSFGGFGLVPNGGDEGGLPSVA
jgi:hypothetical protein